MIPDIVSLVANYLTESSLLNFKLSSNFPTCSFKGNNKFKKCYKNNYIISLKILLLLGKNFNFNKGLFGACFGGYIDIVKLMMC